ncbi:ATP-grasp domain-containing protein, partial [Candidatus Dojkabacteria bacterium]|nr:ATP-grasp domain-containing protein [Candidatus Dojkabacteria bacterium]
IDYSPIVDQLEKNGCKVFCLEKTLGTYNPIFRNSNKLLETVEVQEYVKKHTDTGEIPNVMFFKIAPNLEKTCEKLGYKILNTSSELNHRFEHKISQYNELEKLSNRFPVTEISTLEDADYQTLSKKLGDKFVIQFNRGHTGESTVFVDNNKQFSSLQQKFPKRKARISEFISGDYWTVNCCQTRFGTLWGGLSYQITGIEECTAVSGGTVGNDWAYGRNLPVEVRKEISSICEEVGAIMAKSGYKGLFGLDLVVTPDQKVKLIEVNARQPASTSMHTKLMLSEDQIPLQKFHIAEFLGLDDRLYIDFLGLSQDSNPKELVSRQNELATMPLDGAQIVIRNKYNKKVTINQNFDSGVYRIDKYGEPEVLRSGYSIDNIEDENEALIIVKTKGHKVSSNDEIGRIQVRGGLISDSKQVKNDIMNFIKIIQQIYR